MGLSSLLNSTHKQSRGFCGVYPSSAYDHKIVGLFGTKLIYIPLSLRFHHNDNNRFSMHLLISKQKQGMIERVDIRYSV